VIAKESSPDFENSAKVAMKVGLRENGLLSLLTLENRRFDLPTGVVIHAHDVREIDSRPVSLNYGEALGAIVRAHNLKW
jgi:hypothetical protein